MPIIVAARSKAWTVFARSNVRIVGSNPSQCMDVCIVCAFIPFFVLFCVKVEALRLADPQSKESYRLFVGSRNWKSGQSPKKGCTAIKKFIKRMKISCTLYYLVSWLKPMVSFKPQPLQLCGIALDVHWIRGWVGLKASLHYWQRRKNSCPCRESNPGLPAST
jgi:hypothetical protein